MNGNVCAYTKLSTFLYKAQTLSGFCLFRFQIGSAQGSSCDLPMSNGPSEMPTDLEQTKLDQIKQEILEEMRRELQKAKQEIIEGEWMS